MSFRFFPISTIVALCVTANLRSENAPKPSFLAQNNSILGEKISLYINILASENRTKRVQEKITRDISSQIKMVRMWIDEDFPLIISNSKALKLDGLFIAENKSRLLSRVTEMELALDGVHEKLGGNSILLERLRILEVQLKDLTKLSEEMIEEYSLDAVPPNP